MAICSRKAADVFLADCAEADSDDSAVIAVLAEVTDALEGFVPSPDVAEEPRDAEDTFLGVSTVVLLFNVGIDGFLNNPLIDGRLVGRAAKVLAPNLETEASGPRFSGLGVLDRATVGVLGGRMPWTEARTDFLSVAFPAASWSEIVWRPLDGVLSIVERGFLYALIDDRKFETPSSSPELDPGLLLAPDRPWLDPSD